MHPHPRVLTGETFHVVLATNKALHVTSGSMQVAAARVLIRGYVFLASWPELHQGPSAELFGGFLRRRRHSVGSTGAAWGHWMGFPLRVLARSTHPCQSHALLCHPHREASVVCEYRRLARSTELKPKRRFLPRLLQPGKQRPSLSAPSRPRSSTRCGAPNHFELVPNNPKPPPPADSSALSALSEDAAGQVGQTRSTPRTRERGLPYESTKYRA